jgi:Phosphotransferase enzyme family
LESLAGGRSAAHVFKVTPLCGPDDQVKGLPIVLKISPRAEGEEEKANYDKFVHSALPVMCRPELLGFASTRHHAGLCYSFVGAREGSEVDTLTNYLQRGDTTKVELVLHHIVDAMQDTWYGPPLIREESDIALRYLARYFTRGRETTESEAILQACTARYFNAERIDGGCAIGGTPFPSPHALFFANGRKRSYHSCILHGDLNTDNVITTHEPARVTLVDFQKTGRGHVYEDLVALEAGVRINYPPDGSFTQILESERLIALGRPQAGRNPYGASIRTIRDTASRLFGNLEGAANYHFAVGAIGLRLMQATDLSHVARARVAASTVWAAKVLMGELSI